MYHMFFSGPFLHFFKGKVCFFNVDPFICGPKDLETIVAQFTSPRFRTLKCGLESQPSTPQLGPWLQGTLGTLGCVHQDGQSVAINSWIQRSHSIIIPRTHMTILLDARSYILVYRIPKYSKVRVI